MPRPERSQATLAGESPGPPSSSPGPPARMEGFEPAAVGQVPEPGSVDSAIQGLSMIFGASVKQLVGTAESQQVAILALTSILALLPGVAEIDPKRLAVVVQALTQNRNDADQVRERIGAYVAMVVTLANKLPEVIAEADAKERKEH